jgi:hypothetical protein
MRNFFRGIFTTKLGWLAWGTIGLGSFWGKIWRAIDAWSNIEFFLEKLDKADKLDSFLLALLTALRDPSASPIILAAGFILIFIAGYRAEKKSRSFHADITGEITGIILENKPDSDFPDFKVATFIMVEMQITNRSSVMVSIIDWSLGVQIGNATATAKKINIPPQARITKPTTSFGAGGAILPEPLDKKCWEAPLKQNRPVSGWVLFEIPTINIPDPKNGRLVVYLTDSLSQTHQIIREAIPFPLSGKLIWQG